VPTGGQMSEERLLDLLVEMENLTDEFSDRVEKIAFSIPAANPYTPQLVAEVMALRSAVIKIKMRGHDAAKDATKDQGAT
jgi:hypothetical protein